MEVTTVFLLEQPEGETLLLKKKQTKKTDSCAFFANNFSVTGAMLFTGSM